MYGHVRNQMAIVVIKVVRNQMVIVAIKVSCHCGFIIVFDVKYMTLESIYDSVFCLPYIFSVAPVAFQAIYQFLLWQVP